MKITSLFTAMAVTLAASVTSMPTGNDIDTSLDARTAVSDSTPESLIFRRSGHCGMSSFAGETSTGSPKISDCVNLVEKFNPSKTYKIGTERKEMGRYGNCRFMARAYSANTKLGNEDIRDLLRSSIDRYAKDGRVGARGSMHCAGGGSGAEKVDWWVWKT